MKRGVRVLLACMLYSLPIYIAFSTDWVLGAQEFTVTNTAYTTDAERALAQTLPQLILEQLASDSVRLPTQDEMLSRTLDALQTERLSLFLQLSKEVRTRDSQILLEKNARKRKKAIVAAEKKIRELEEKIRTNIEDTNAARLQVQTARKDGPVPSAQNETVVLYKNDSTALFVPPEKAVQQGEKSRAYERALVNAKINGLVTGTITVYGGYAAVTAELTTYPGGDAGGVVTEVGSLENTVTLANFIARSLWPKVVNSLPVTLIFAIAPADVSPTARIAIDGNLVAVQQNETRVPAGTHTIEISATGYETKTITHRFVDAPQFLVNAVLAEKKEGSFWLFTEEKGKEISEEPLTIYAGGRFLGKDTQLSPLSLPVTGEPLLGQLVRPVFSEVPPPTENDNIIEENRASGSNESIEAQAQEQNEPDESAEALFTQEEERLTHQPERLQTGQLTSFFYIPAQAQQADTALLVKSTVQDTSALIDKRRIWMYRGYTALILTLPLTFYSIGKYDSAYNAYYSGYVDAQEVNKWNRMRVASAGVSILAGGFFIFELIRYLRSASSVLPVTATVTTAHAIPESEKSEGGE